MEYTKGKLTVIKGKYGENELKQFDNEHIAVVKENIFGGVERTIALISPVTLQDDEDIPNAILIANAGKMYEALQEISEGKGRYSLGQFEHAKNTIEGMKEVAQNVLDEIGEEYEISNNGVI